MCSRALSNIPRWCYRLLPSGSRGTAAVEFALCLPLIMAFLMGGLEFGRAFYLHQTMVKAARDAARFLAHTSDPTNGTFQTIAKNLAQRGSTDSSSPLLIPNPNGSTTPVVTVTFTIGTTSDVHTAYYGSKQIVTVNLIYDFTSPLLKFFGYGGAFTFGVAHSERELGG